MPEEDQDIASDQGDSQQPEVQQNEASTPPDAGHQEDAQTQGDDSQINQPPDNQRVDQKNSSQNSKSVASNTQSQEERIDADSYKRLRDQHSQLGRDSAGYRKQLEAQRLELTRFQQERERQDQFAKQQKLALHDYRHPDHASKFIPLQAKADIVRSQLASLAKTQPPEGLTPEQGQQWRQSAEQHLLSTLTEEEQGTLSAFQQHNQTFQRQWATNPDQVLTERVIPMIRQEMQRAMQQREAVESVSRDMADPELGPVMKEMGSEMQEAIQRLSRGDADEAYDFVKQQAMVYAHNRKMNDGLSQENARLKQQLADAGIRVGAAKAQQDLARGRASITRDVSTRQTRPAYEVASEWASKNGVDKSSAQFHQKLRELENQAR
jgi:hypothetical protein